MEKEITTTMFLKVKYDELLKKLRISEDYIIDDVIVNVFDDEIVFVLEKEGE